jgi:hypothetical protein
MWTTHANVDVALAKKRAVQQEQKGGAHGGSSQEGPGLLGGAAQPSWSAPPKSTRFVGAFVAPTETRSAVSHAVVESKVWSFPHSL